MNTRFICSICKEELIIKTKYSNDPNFVDFIISPCGTCAKDLGEEISNLEEEIENLEEDLEKKAEDLEESEDKISELEDKIKETEKELTKIKDESYHSGIERDLNT